MKKYDRRAILTWLRRVVPTGQRVRMFDLWIWAGRDKVSWNRDQSHFSYIVKATVHGHSEFKLTTANGNRLYMERLKSSCEFGGLEFGSVWINRKFSKHKMLKNSNLDLVFQTEKHSKLKPLEISNLSLENPNPLRGASRLSKVEAAALPPLATVTMAIEKNVPLPEPYISHPTGEVMAMLTPTLKKMEIGDSIQTPKEFGGLLLQGQINRTAAKWRKAGLMRGYRCRIIGDGGMRVWRYR